MNAGYWFASGLLTGVGFCEALWLRHRVRTGLPPGGHVQTRPNKYLALLGEADRWSGPVDTRRTNVSDVTDELVAWFHTELGDRCRHSEDVVTACENWAQQFLRTGPRLADRGAAGVEARVRALVDRWEREAAERAPDDVIYTHGVVALLRAALSGPADEHPADGTGLT